eukprot:797399-Rhodomonas_salina.1
MTRAMLQSHIRVGASVPGFGSIRGPRWKDHIPSALHFPRRKQADGLAFDLHRQLDHARLVVCAGHRDP